MATKDSKSKKRSGKKDDASSVGDKSMDDLINDELPSETPISSEIAGNLHISIGELPLEDIHIVYEEPALAELIVESYEGEKVKGLFDGEAVIHFTGSHVYQGEFSEGLMHGTGKYTWADGLTYEGHFFQNQVTGKGIYRWPDGSSFEGDVLNGKRHGIGVFHCKNNTQTYSGEWCFGRRHGKGRMDYDTNKLSYYDGEWVNNARHGWGMRQYPSGNVYQGVWYSNVRHGDGTMKWLDQDQIYTGQWENGVQHGVGQHVWLLRRVSSSQYPLRNMYDGEFLNGLRHGHGTFYYANGSKYEGGWKNNLKHGQGKFTFKNGRIYEGMFEKDHIVEYPDFNLGGATSPDVSMIRTRTPLPFENLSVHSNMSKNTVSPSFQLDVQQLLQSFTDLDHEEEAKQVMCVMMRHTMTLRKIYQFYGQLGYEGSPDNTYIINRMQFWRFLKDCRLHHHGKVLMDMDRLLGYDKAVFEMHNPNERILFRTFLNNLVALSFHIYHKQHNSDCALLAWCLSCLITNDILPRACSVKGHFYYETSRAVTALVHLDQAYDVYVQCCGARKYPPNDPSIAMRKFLHMLQDMGLLNSRLTAKAVIDTLASDDPNVSDGDGCYNMELEMTFLEFFEALIGCAEIYVTEEVVNDPSTPPPASPTLDEHSTFSLPVSPSRGATSQGALDDGDNLPGSQTEIAPSVISMARHGTASMTDTVQKGGREAQPSSVSSSAIKQTDKDSSEQQPQQQQKSASNISSHTNFDDDNITAILSDNYLQDVMPDQTDSKENDLADGDGDEEMQEQEEEEELDEETRKFNFWTHQVHIFFVRKFFPAAEKMIRLANAVSKRSLEESKQRLSVTQNQITTSQSN